MGDDRAGDDLLWTFPRAGRRWNPVSASQRRRASPLSFEPEHGDPLANVVVIEPSSLDAQNTSGVLDLALRFGELGPFELREKNILGRGQEDAVPAKVPRRSAAEFGQAGKSPNNAFKEPRVGAITMSMSWDARGAP
jgi:hypothetical protein